MPEVIDCSVEGVPDDIQGEVLKAIVVIKKELTGTVTAESIARHCSKYLALYKVPKIFEIKEELYISASGKKIKIR
jgi:acyl-CoA synthetase (AMP-forming)/AMP-acid ligase II